MGYKERNENLRNKFQEELEKVTKEKRVYIDESWIDHNEVKDKSWSPIWKPTPWEKYWNKWWRTTLIAWVRQDKVLAPFRFEGMTNTDIFNTWIETCLIPELGEGDVIILDNASFHKSMKTIELIKGIWARVLFLPPYSPDLNPIENYWALLKNYVRKFNNSFDIFYKVLDDFLNKLYWCYLS